MTLAPAVLFDLKLKRDEARVAKGAFVQTDKELRKKEAWSLAVGAYGSDLLDEVLHLGEVKQLHMQEIARLKAEVHEFRSSLPADAPPTDRDAAGGASDLCAALDVLVPLARLANSFDGHVDGDNGQATISVRELRAARRVIGSPPGADPQKTVDAIRAANRAPTPGHQDRTAPAVGEGIVDTADVLVGLCENRDYFSIGVEPKGEPLQRYRISRGLAVEIRDSIDGLLRLARAARATPPAPTGTATSTGEG